MGELTILEQAHLLFADAITPPALRTAGFDRSAEAVRGTEAGSGVTVTRYRTALDAAGGALRRSTTTDTALASVLSDAARDQATARRLTREVLTAAKADPGAPAYSPVAQREAILRKIARLRAQHGHVEAARRQAARRLALVRALRYFVLRRLRAKHLALPPPNNRGAIAVRAALSRLGRPYVWGATGPDQFDCSGLVQWAYRQAGIGLDRTTYGQINDGSAVPRSQVQPGDLVFPHSGHVQMAIGNGMVIEAPHAGANVRISPLGDSVAIRRPVG